ncbi:MAG: hypothetical protein MUE73_07940 [Planctomycetes bacterium]|nr:hypothetical protein [Planctomycetota bacterium]
MSTGDPFETFRWKREVQRMETEFRDNAATRRRRIAELSQGEDDTLEFERKVALEMRDFLQDSASAAERVLGDIVESGDGAGPAEAEIRQKLEALIAGTSPPTGEVELPEAMDDAENGAGAIRRRALARKYGARPPDLRAALSRIRLHSGAPPEEEALEGPKTPDGHASRTEILATFDETCHRVASLLVPDGGDEQVAVVEPLAEAPRAGPGPADELRDLRDEVRRLRRIVDTLVRKGILSEADL